MNRRFKTTLLAGISAMSVTLEYSAAAYAADTHQHANSLIEGGVVKTPDRDHFKRVSEQTIERLAKDGLI